MADEIVEKSEKLGERIEAFKEKRNNPTPQEEYDYEAGEHADKEGTALNSGKA